MMNTLKFLAFVRLYITYIFQVRVKHYLSTDIVLITQNLRKKIRQGKTYFTGTSILLKKRFTISAQNQIKTAGSSGSLRVLFEDLSTLRRTKVSPSSGVLRLLFGCPSGRTRSAVEAVPKPSRSVAEHVSNMSRRSPEAEPKATRRGVGASPSSNFFLTNFALTSAFHAMGLGCSSNFPLIFPEGDPKPTRRNSEQSWEKGRSWSGIGRIVVCCLAVVFQSSNYSFKVLKSIKALALLALMVSMFSLSAQTPRKDSGADGSVKVEPLLVGQKLPEKFWKREYLVYNNGDTTRQTLEAYRGKLLVLDFWATWCAICLGQMKEKDELFSRFPADAKLIYVNPTQTKDTYTNIVKIQDRLAEHSLSGKFHSIIEEDYLQQLFPNHIYPRYVWIGPRGDLIGLTLALSVTDGHIKDMLNLINPKDGKK